MDWQITPYTFAAAVAGGLALGLGVLGWRRRPVPGAAEFAFFAVAVGDWCLAAGIAFARTDLAGRILGSKFEYIGVVSAPVLWLLCMAACTGTTRRRPRWQLVGLAVIPLITLGLVFSNEQHGLIWRTVEIDQQNGLGVWKATYGAWFWVHSAYSYLMLAGATLLILRQTRRDPFFFLSQGALLLIGMFIPWATNMVYLSGLSPFPNLDLTPLGFALGAAAVGAGLLRFGLFDVVPIAREALVEGLPDAVVVLDLRDRVVALNPAAERLLAQPSRTLLGRSATEIASVKALLGALPGEISAAQLRAGPSPVADDRQFEVGHVALADRRGRPVGRLVVVRDITQRKNVEQERVRIALALHDRVEQTFFSIGLSVTALLASLTALPPESVYAALAGIRNSAQQGEEDLRAAIFALTRAEAHDLELVQSLWQLVREFQQRTGLEADLAESGAERRASPEIAEVLHAVAREGLSNVERHSRASAVVVSLAFEPDAVTLTVQDDGVGASALVLSTLADSATRFGLNGSRERVLRLGGTFRAEPGDDEGFVVRARVPFRDHE